VIYLAHTAAHPDQILAAGLADDLIELVAGLLAVDTDLSRSKLYHGLKRLQPKDSPLLVSTLTEAPKLKGMAAGSTAWLRTRLV
jgi:hypothetical protein